MLSFVLIFSLLQKDKIHSVFQSLTLENSMYFITLKNCLLIRCVKAAALAYAVVEVFRPTAVLKPSFILNHSVCLKISGCCCNIKGIWEPRNMVVGCSVSTQFLCLFLFCLLSYIPCVVLPYISLCSSAVLFFSAL